MRIGLNGTAYDALSSGARERFLRLYGETARQRPRHEFLLYSPRDVDLAPLFPGPLAGSARTPFTPARPLRRFLGSARWFSRRLRRDRVDLFVTDHFPVLSGCGVETLLTIHDLRYLLLPGAGSRLRRFWFRRRFARTAARAAAVVAVSGTVRGEILTHLHLPPDRVHVVPNGVGVELGPAAPEQVRSLGERLGLPRRYLLNVGVLEARKNLGLLLSLLAREDLPPLVIAGRGGPEERALRRRAAGIGVADRVLLVGYVGEADLPALYTGASALLMPSRYEGFGLPVLQALACGIPVVCSRASALPEVAGDAALLCPPEDEEAWRRAVRRILDEPELRALLAAAGKARAATMTWAASARSFAHLLDGFASGGAHVVS